ncbi:MAG TPA: S8 family serine peptidase [Pyrinomonadaceae bacterium]|nr:S8 family serine peptidase [Pyrinomonadaceae bacterium]
MDRKLYRFSAGLLSLALLLSGVFAGSPAAASKRSGRKAASPSDKISPDLRESARRNGGERVTVIVQPKGEWGDEQEGTVRAHGGRVKHKFENMDERVVEVPAGAVEALAARDDVAYVSPERETAATGHLVSTTGGLMQNPLAKGTLDGTGVGIAVMDSGVFAGHMTFMSGKTSRVVKSVDFTGEGRTDDPYGHGTHVASAAASNASVTRMQNGFPVDYAGRAANAKIINLRVLNSQGKGTLSGLLQAVDWVIANRTAYNIKVVNMSLGMAAVDSFRNDPACKAVRRLVDAGVVVVVAAGNNGKDDAGQKVYGQVHSPGNEPSAITVGASNTYGTDIRSDDTVATYSSRGPTRSYWTDVSGTRYYDHIIKPDLVAPGNKIISAQATGNKLITEYPQMDPGVNVGFSTNSRLMYMSGTSVAAPVVAGAAALMLQMQPKLTPNLVRMILMYTAQQLRGFNAFEQGAGQLNSRAAIDLAKLVRTDLTASTPLGAPLLTAAAPAPQTPLLGEYVRWSQGVVAGHTYLTGAELITKYQKIYGTGVLLSDGITISEGVLLADTALLPNQTMMSSGVLLADTIRTSFGTTMSEGSVFCSTGVLITDGVLVADNMVFGDGVLIGDGVLVSDGVLVGDYSSIALRATVNGDDTACMK